MAVPGDTPDRWALLGGSLVSGLVGPFILFIWHRLWSVGRELRALSTSAGAGVDAGAGTGPFAGPPPAIWALLALGIGLLALAVIGPAVALHRDARFVARAGEWTPNPRAWALGAAAFPLSIVVTGGYLWRRRRRVGRHPPGHPTVADLRASRLPAVAAILPAMSAAAAVALAWGSMRSGDVLALTAGIVAAFGLVTVGYLGFLVCLGFDFDWLQAASVAPSLSRFGRLVSIIVAFFLPGLLFLAAPLVGWLWLRRRQRWLQG